MVQNNTKQQEDLVVVTKDHAWARGSRVQDTITYFLPRTTPSPGLPPDFVRQSDKPADCKAHVPVSIANPSFCRICSERHPSPTAPR